MAASLYITKLLCYYSDEYSKKIAKGKELQEREREKDKVTIKKLARYYI